MTTAMQIGETARDRADFCRGFKTGAAVFLHDDGIVAHSTYRNTLRAAYMPARTNCDTRGCAGNDAVQPQLQGPRGGAATTQRGAYTRLADLPFEPCGGPRYRIKCKSERVERVVTEAQISRLC